MKFRDLLYETWYALSANKGRSFLTILGIVIGISAVIAMTALIGGIQNALMGELGFAQARQAMISAYSPTGNITFDDLENLEEQLPQYEFITGYTQAFVPIKTATKSVDDSTIFCVKPDYFVANGISASSGRLFTGSEEANGARYIIIDKLSIKEFFGDENASVIGQSLQIGDNDFEIIGVVETSPMMSYGTTVYLPYTTAVQRLGVDPWMQMTGFAHEGENMEALSALTTEVVAEYFGIEIDEVYVFAFETVIQEMETMMSSFSFLMGAVASVSLFVGGIGIMNMMLTNVTERIREIGLRKSLGARRRDVTKQFLLEAIMLCVVGGIVGIFMGLAAAWGLGVLVNMADMGMGSGMAIMPVLDPEVVFGAVAVCVLIGLVFGYYPARRAAKLDPVESLRYQ